MKLKDYFNFVSSSEETNSITSDKIEQASTKTKDLLEPSTLKKDVVSKINRLLNEANKKLKRDVPFQQIKYKFVSEDTPAKNVDDKIDESKKEIIKKRWLTLNSELAKIQMEWEEKQIKPGTKSIQKVEAIENIASTFLFYKSCLQPGEKVNLLRFLLL